MVVRVVLVWNELLFFLRLLSDLLPLDVLDSRIPYAPVCDYQILHLRHLNV